MCTCKTPSGLGTIMGSGAVAYDLTWSDIWDVLSGSNTYSGAAIVKPVPPPPAPQIRETMVSWDVPALYNARVQQLQDIAKQGGNYYIQDNSPLNSLPNPLVPNLGGIWETYGGLLILGGIVLYAASTR